MRHTLEKLGQCKTLEEVADWKESCEKELQEKLREWKEKYPGWSVNLAYVRITELLE